MDVLFLADPEPDAIAEALEYLDARHCGWQTCNGCLLHGFDPDTEFAILLCQLFDPRSETT